MAFNVVILRGMGSIPGAVISGFGPGRAEGLTKLVSPAASGTVIFLVMILVLLTRPAGLFGRRP